MSRRFKGANNSVSQSLIQPGEFTDFYMFALPTGSSKAERLICSGTAAINKRSKAERPYVAKHESFEQI